MVPPMVAWSLLHQLIIKTIPLRHSQLNKDITQLRLLFRVILGCVEWAADANLRQQVNANQGVLLSPGRPIYTQH